MDPVTRFIEAWKVTDGSAMADLLEHGALWEDVTRCRLVARSELRRSIKALHASSSCLSIETTTVVRGSDTAAIELEISGVDDRGLRMNSSGPTGRFFRLHLAAFLTIEGDRVSHYRLHWDLCNFLAQLGLDWLISDIDWRMKDAMGWE